MRSVVMIDVRDIQDIRDIARENEERRRKEREQFHRDYKTALNVVREHQARGQVASIAVT